MDQPAIIEQHPVTPDVETPHPTPIHPLDEFFNQYLNKKGYQFSKPISICSITDQRDTDTNIYETFLQSIGINPESTGFRNAARIISSLTQTNLPESEKSHYLEIFYSFWDTLQKEALESDITQLEELLTPQTEPELPDQLKQQIDSLFHDGRDTNPYHQIVQQLLRIDPENGAESFFSIQKLPDQTPTEINNQAETLLAFTQIPPQYQPLIARLLAACTHTISGKNYSLEAQAAYAVALNETLSFIKSEGTLEKTTIDSKFSQSIINEAGINSNDDTSTRFDKIDKLFDKATQGDAVVANKIGIHPSIYSYAMQSRFVGERINNDFPGFVIEGGLACIRNNQVVETKHDDGSTHLIVITGDATNPSKESWQLVVFTSNGAVLTPEETSQFYSLQVVSEHHRSYSQLSTIVPLAGAREFPVQLFRTIFGLEQTQLRPRSKKLFPNCYPEITTTELNSIRTSNPPISSIVNYS